jgi:hypothetical protein
MSAFRLIDWRISIGSGLQLLGGLVIGMAVGFLVIAPLLVKYNESTTNEINQILSTWRSRHPTDPVAQTWAVTPPEVYQAAMNLTNFSWGLIVIGVISVIGGEIALYPRTFKHGLQGQLPPPPVEEKIFCRYCAAENKKDAVYCQKCGKSMR